MVIDKSEVFAKRLAENLCRYTPDERKCILARYGLGAEQIRREIRAILIKEKRWLST